jgi:hypothetical protein
MGESLSQRVDLNMPNIIYRNDCPKEMMYFLNTDYIRLRIDDNLHFKNLSRDIKQKIILQLVKSRHIVKA